MSVQEESLFSWYDGQLATQLFAADSLDLDTSSVGLSENGALDLNVQQDEYSDQNDESDRHMHVDVKHSYDSAAKAIGAGGSNQSTTFAQRTSSIEPPPPIAINATPTIHTNTSFDSSNATTPSSSRTASSSHAATKKSFSSSSSPVSSVASVSTTTSSNNNTAQINVSNVPVSSTSTTTISSSKKRGSANSASSSKIPPPPPRTTTNAASVDNNNTANPSSTTTAIAAHPVTKRAKSSQSQSCANCSKAHRKCVISHRPGYLPSCSACIDRHLDCSFKSLPILMPPTNLAVFGGSSEQRVISNSLTSTIRTALLRSCDYVPNANVSLVGTCPQYVISLHLRADAMPDSVAHNVPLPVFSDANDEFCTLVGRTRAELKVTPMYEIVRPSQEQNRWAGWATYVAPPQTLTLDISGTPMILTTDGWRKCKAHVKFYFGQDGPWTRRIVAVHATLEAIGERSDEAPVIPPVWGTMADSIRATALAINTQDGEQQQQQAQQEPAQIAAAANQEEIVAIKSEPEQCC